ncbi:MAG: hypothetical protein HOF29_07915 [Candidatus Marinimicrobia bacterium]|nr:hypothetical protein [Candidatus Neomarinimicrobiota bacterium]MBT3681769.1 hypothetical protein [Candidatus Neomarinimicrobiota bacterium]MBT3895983.1 hypothetical protein [Candidatus Neomarinimicrobiota bacterium]MBT4171860.1 hypothetical protein [Candidatus Neomarinimicrobiota bacterium]MBT4850774.1 hypothetical protein [Candidatus Neomarinimicrobiota bacterium]
MNKLSTIYCSTTPANLNKRLSLLSHFLNFFFIIVMFSSVILPQDNETCEDCHDDESLSTVMYGIEYSLYITSDHLIDTPHEDFECIDCHTDLEGVEDFPHNEGLILPDCSNCHEDATAEFIDGFFQPLRDKGYTSIPTCSDCHGTHEVTWKGQPRQVCGICHQDILDDFLHSAHWDENSESSEITCVSCHSPHNKLEKNDYTENQWKLHITEYCSDCHKSQVELYNQSGHYSEVLNGNLSAPICSDCHARHKILSPQDPNSRVSVAKLDVICTNCHAHYEQSIHRPENQDDPRLETCIVCHTGHSTEMIADTKSQVIDLHLFQLCLQCHDEKLITGTKDAHGGIHRNELDKLDQGEPADCGNCHKYHFNTEGSLVQSGLQKSCAECHPKQQEEYENSSHFIAREKGHSEAPDCMTCHGMVEIQKTDGYFSGKNVVELCGNCHGDREMTLKFQLSSEVMKGYSSSYHGQMYQLGYQGEEFATCVSCHDNHSIMASDNPASSVGREHIMETCAKCHENVTPNFVEYLQHYTPMQTEENVVLKYIHLFMLWLLGGTLTVFGGHTLLWFIRLMIKKWMHGPIKKTPKTMKRVMRFSVFERTLHFGIIISFLSLAATGLPLKYSHSELATWFVNNLLGFKTAALLHRGAAILIFIIFLIHLIILANKAFVQKKKGIFFGPDSLVPNIQDFRDFFSHIAYFIGAKNKEPKFGRWTYWEKFDYFAVFWGMIIIGMSGVTLWFPELFSRMFPGWIINAAHIIHSEEALLATAFIFTIHFFNTHLRPGAFPMDEVIFTGRLTEEIFNDDRSLQKDLLSEQDYKNILVDPSPKWLKRFTYILGYLFLTIGFVLLVLIIIGSFF